MPEPAVDHLLQQQPRAVRARPGEGADRAPRADDRRRGRRVRAEVAEAWGEPGPFAGDPQAQAEAVGALARRDPGLLGQVLQADPRPAGQPVPGGHADEHRLRAEVAHREPADLRRRDVGELADHRERDPSGPQQVQDRLGGGLQVRHLLVLRQQVPHHRRDHRHPGAVHPAERHRLRGLRRPGQRPRRGQQLAEAVEQFPGPAQDMDAQLGRDHAVRPPPEQRPAELLLDPPQLRGQSGLRDLQRGGRAADAARLGHREHDPQMAQSHVHVVPQRPLAAGSTR
ncbi:hypothetical protein VSR01_03480 [Actinacidiphila sp. DG2A-62]|nr:hypothetical protein [Actinacidiphila sp. DG2A-62]MEC3992657.1 hypothetical protein [Actinacidiphila sp. DG2A-62]